MTKIKKSLFIFCGQVGAGKTTTANLFGNKIGAKVFSVDSTLKNILKNPSFVGKDKPPTIKELNICYNVFSLLTDLALASGQNIIIDGAFSKRVHREVVIQSAKKHGAKFFIIYVFCPDDILKKRVQERFRKGNGVGWNAHLKIKKIYEKIEKPHYTIDSSRDVKFQLENILKEI